MSKKKKVFVVTVLAVFLVGSIPYNIAQDMGYFRPIFKITNPSNPFFNPNWFNFTDYPVSKNNFAKSSKYMRQLFPVGMPKEEVEKILVKAGKATPRQSKDHSELWFYRRPTGFLSRSHHSVIYDENDRLQNYIMRAYPLYPDQITKKDLRKQK